MVLERLLANDIKVGAEHFPVVAILGPRQAGKTTLAKSLFSNHIYITLEDPDARAAAEHDPRTFLIANRNEHGIIIDEFQYVPALLSYIQTMVDTEQKNGQFILTGSQNFLMNQAITQSLAGRISLHTLLPLSVAELRLNAKVPAEVEQVLSQGSYPAIYAKNVPAENLYKNYLNTYIERDVRQLAQVGDLATFQTFIRLCAARVGQVLNKTSLANDCGISDHTVSRWLSILQAGYIIFLLQPYHNNFGKRLIKSPKLYFYDAGIVCSLLQIKEHELAMHPNRGNIFESFIVSEIVKHYYNKGQAPRIYFWRDNHDNEIDCIIEDGMNLMPVEIKSSRTFNTRFLDGLRYWKNINPDATLDGYVVFAGASNQPRLAENVISWQLCDTMLER